VWGLDIRPSAPGTCSSDALGDGSEPRSGQARWLSRELSDQQLAALDPLTASLHAASVVGLPQAPPTLTPSSRHAPSAVEHTDATLPAHVVTRLQRIRSERQMPRAALPELQGQTVYQTGPMVLPEVLQQQVRWMQRAQSYGVEHSATPLRAHDGGPAAAEAAWLEREEVRAS
jgi:hypothetical protein